jgi:hypothetical protein
VNIRVNLHQIVSANELGHVKINGRSIHRWAGPFSGPAQSQYANYFNMVLLSPTLRQPKHLSKLLRQIVFSGLEGLNYKALTAGGSSIYGGGKSEDVIPFLAGQVQTRNLLLGGNQTRLPDILRIEK